MGANQRKGDLAYRLWTRTERQDNGCLVFTGYVDKQTGYGQISSGNGRKLLLTHRAAWKVTYGDIPKGLFVLHRCDNRPCVEPTHLFLGTHQDNMRDMKEKGRNHVPRGFDNANCRLTLDEVNTIRQAAAAHIPHKSIAAQFGITTQYVGQLASGKWRRTA